MIRISMPASLLFLLSSFHHGYGEIGPDHFVPLEVGNSWTYEHWYGNESYPQVVPKLEPWLLKPVEIPGYPHGVDNPVPPDSLTNIIKPLTIEITHTETIEGLEYFVFSGPDYSWPPNLPFFWAGKKVRLTEEGVVMFRLDGRDIPWFDFDPPGTPRPGVIFEYDELPYSEYGEYEIRIGGYDVVIDPETSDVIRWGLQSTPPWSLDQVLTRRFTASLPWTAPTSGEWNAEFLPGYGMGLCRLHYGPQVYVSNSFWPISATISGETVSYLSLYTDYPWRTAVHPTSWGQIKSSFTKNRRLAK